jgi:hypothetical protein
MSRALGLPILEALARQSAWILGELARWVRKEPSCFSAQFWVTPTARDERPAGSMMWPLDFHGYDSI